MPSTIGNWARRPDRHLWKDRRVSTLWSGRFTTTPDAEVFDYGRSLSVDRRMVEDDITGSVAWSEALAKAGVLTAADALAIESGLEAIRQAVRADPALIERAEDEDVHSFVE